MSEGGWTANGIMMWDGTKVIIELEMPRWFTVRMAAQQRRVRVRITPRYLNVSEVPG